jgi:hypothetical protein
MQAMQGPIEGPVIVDRDLDIHGTIVGDAVVRPSFTLHLRGVITGNLTIEKGATAIIYGTVDGRIRKTGGTVVIIHPQGQRQFISDKFISGKFKCKPAAATNLRTAPPPPSTAADERCRLRPRRGPRA